MKKLTQYSLLCIGVLSIASALAATTSSTDHTATGQLGVTSKASDSSSSSDSTSSSGLTTTEKKGLEYGGAAAGTLGVAATITGVAIKSKQAKSDASDADEVSDASDASDASDVGGTLAQAKRVTDYYDQPDPQSVEGQSDTFVESPISNPENQEGAFPDTDPLLGEKFQNTNSLTSGESQVSEATAKALKDAGEEEATATNGAGDGADAVANGATNAVEQLVEDGAELGEDAAAL